MHLHYMRVRVCMYDTCVYVCIYLWMNTGSGSYNNAAATSSSPADLDPGATASTAAPSLSQSPCAVIQSAGNVASETGQAMDMYVKILNPANRKEYKMYTLRGLRREDIDCPTNSLSVGRVWCPNHLRWSLDIFISLRRSG